jgi:hypothetical protein
VQLVETLVVVRLALNQRVGLVVVETMEAHYR